MNKTNNQIEYSFEKWCKDNKRQDLLDRWDYELNDISPSKISYKSNKKYWFKCPRNIHESQLQNIQYFAAGKQQDMKCTKCNSFAQYIIDNYDINYLNKIWNINNILDPWKISYKSNIKAIFNCLNNTEHVYEQKIYHYSNGIKCPYCTHQKVFQNESLGYLYPESIKLWSDKNKKTPYDYYPKSSKKVYWKCPDGIHKDFERVIYSMVNSGFKCPNCSSANRGENQRKDLTGQKFGMLTVICMDKEKSRNSNKTYWLCKCDCGNLELKSIAGTHLTLGETISCGCLEHPSGERNPNWKGGITPQYIKERSTPEYNQWRKAVYKKDNYTCQCCGRRNNLNAHHILPFSKYIDKRIDINNGITLCEKCHSVFISDSFHNLYGTTNNTPEQLEEYINYKRKKLGIDIPFSIEAYKNGEILKPENINKNISQTA